MRPAAANSRRRAASGPRLVLIAERLAAFATAAGRADNPLTVFRAFRDFAEGLAPLVGVFISLYDPVLQERRCVYTAGEGIEDDVASLPPLGMTESPNSRAISEDRPILERELERVLAPLPKVDLHMEMDLNKPKGSLAVPMHAHGRVIGAIEIQSAGAEDIGDELVEPIVAAAGIVGFAIEAFGRREIEPVPVERSLEDAAIVRRLIESRAFRPVFQPVVDIATGTPVAFEALTRFDDGTPPDRYFEMARTAGLSIELDCATAEAAFAGAAELPANAWLHINAAPTTILVREPLGSILREWGWQTVLEVTEHAAVLDYPAFRGAITELADGVRLAIDDAGAGFASLRHILELRPAFVKLDRQLISGIDTDPAKLAIVAGLVHFQERTGTLLVAEGVETADEAAALREAGVTLGQGYYFARPAPAARWAGRQAGAMSVPIEAETPITGSNGGHATLGIGETAVTERSAAGPQSDEG